MKAVQLLCIVIVVTGGIIIQTNHKDEEKLEKERDDFDRNVSTLEPFLESSLQVTYRVLDVISLFTHANCHKVKLHNDISIFVFYL